MNSLDDIRFNINKLEKCNDGERINVSIDIPMSLGWIDDVKFIVDKKEFNLKHISNNDFFAHFEDTIFLPTKAIYHYYFSFKVNNNNINYGNDKNFKLSINFEVPSWAKGKIMYHIFVDRFNKSNDFKLEEMPYRSIHESWDEDIFIGEDKNGRWNADFYGGNIKGIIEKIDYIKSLGVSILYLSPVVWSQSNHRYDTSDYEKVDVYAGTNDDLKELCRIAHENGMKVILDAVFNHTGNDSKYFNEYNTFDELGAYQSSESKYYSFYKKYISNNKVFFDYWWGMKNLPVCDGASLDWQNYIYGKNGIIDLWFSLGIDGLRLDVADELSDEFIEDVRDAVKRNKEDGFILGEVWKNPMRMNRGYIESGKGMDSVMNYQLVNALIRYYKYADCNTLKYVMDELIKEYPTDTLNSLMNFTSTHDITRAINIFGTDEFLYNGEWSWNLRNDDRLWQKEYKMNTNQYELGKKIYSSYIYALTFLPGNLSIFYGDEIGMQGMGNLANRRTFTWNNIDYDLLRLFMSVGKIRNEEKYLEEASIEVIDINDKYVSFKRESDSIELLTIASRSNDKVSIYLPDEYNNEEVLCRLNNSIKTSLEPYGGITLKKVKKDKILCIFIKVW